ncbi:urease accessory protein UreD [Peterkaempfera bronchialis]|uniref:Urease accessory protein UreD n=1 Tax=Peterkaempfera bronchialis TaxID=2126346 RepID=A0A345SRL3_9ACTN|nr:urease accessory protein UreD [Peterkaempfera bronchialis]AXI76368.1 urease accessory protein UreD [Peterkaempfera bronchialis]
MTVSEAEASTEAEPTVITVERVGDRHTALDLRPGAFLAPRPLLPTAGGLRIALVATSAGLLAGDRLRLHITVGPGARLEMVEPAGLVAYHHRGGASSWHARVDIGPGGELRWRGSPFVVADGARVDRRMDVRLAAGARMLWRDTLVLGRSGERGGSVCAATRVAYGGRELFAEDLDLTDPDERELPGILGHARVLASVASFGRTPPERPGHPYRTDLAGPGALVRLLGGAAPGLDAQLDPLWQAWHGPPPGH